MNEQPCIEAITAARWWGGQLRILRERISLIVEQTEDDFVAASSSLFEKATREEYRHFLRLFNSLQEENIHLFERLLAATIHVTVKTYHFCMTQQRCRYTIDPTFASLLQQSGIESMQRMNTPIFNQSMATGTRQGHVHAQGGFDPAQRNNKVVLSLVEV
jgi:hypothetical protein